MAADYYVDRDVVDTTNTCTMPQPCDQIGEALGLADANDTSADTIHVGRSTGAYPAVTIPSTPVTLLGGEFNAGLDGSSTLIDGNAAAGVSLTPSSFARTVKGFTVRGGATPPFVCALQGFGSTGVTVQQNTFDESSTQLDAHICLDDSPTISGNTILGNGQVEGIDVVSSVSPQVSGNTVQGVERAVYVAGGGTTTGTVKNNTLFPLGLATPPAAGIYLNGVAGDISGNTITMDPATTLSQTDGIYAANNSSGGTLRLSRNTIRGFTSSSGNGVELVTPDPVALDSDVIADNTVGVDASSVNLPSISLTNVTLWGNTAASGDLKLGGTVQATVDSSIIGNQGVSLAGGASCSSGFSRGPSGNPTCGPFATNAAPSYLNAVAGDYHLTTGGNGPLIETGNPAAPGPLELDIDGQPRAMDFNGDCIARRDIGADEVAPTAFFNCNPPSDTTAPDTGVSGLPVVRIRRRRTLAFFNLTSTEPGSTFKCSLDGSPFFTCVSPLGMILRRGAHSMTAVAIDKAGNIDPSPARFVITVLRKKHGHPKPKKGR
jgi:parallel beta-helix repeat protein